MSSRSNDYDLTAVDVADEAVIGSFRRTKTSLPIPKPPQILHVGPDSLTVMLANPSDLVQKDRVDSVTQIDLKIVDSKNEEERLKSSFGRPLPLRIRVRDLRAGMSCKLSVRYCSIMGKSEWSVFTDMISLSKPPGEAPSKLVADEIGRRDVLLRWSTIQEKGITGYIIEKQMEEEGQEQQEQIWTIAIEIEKSEATTARISRLFLNTSYKFRIAAKNAAGLGPFSESISITTRSLEEENNNNSTRKMQSTNRSASRKSNTIKKKFRWSFSSKLVSPRRSVVVDGESIYDQVFRAGDLDSDGRWNLQEFNRIQVKMEHDPLEESQNPGTLHTCWR